MIIIFLDDRFHVSLDHDMFSKKVLFAVIILALAVTTVLVIGYSQIKKPEQENQQVSTEKSDSKSEAKVIQPPAPKPTSITMNTIFFGDVFWGRYVDDWSKKSDLKTAYPFSGLSTLERPKYDAWIADMECPITSTYLDSATQDDQLKFSCPAEYTSEAAKWFTAFTLANNHTDNMEEVKGFAQTRSNLEKNGIQYFGHFDSEVKQDLCEVVSLPAKQNFENGETKPIKFPIALCGLHNVFKLPTEDQMSVIGDYAKYFPTFVMPHQGAEYTYKADSLQTSFAHRYIDLGADGVIGDHVHSVQNTEVYDGKLIVYSLGNFIFDQQSSAQVRQAFGANLDFTFTYTEKLQPYIDMADSCTKFKDSCLSTAATKTLTKPVFSIKYDAIPVDNSGKLAKKASPDIAEQILSQINWAQTSKQLNK